MKNLGQRFEAPAENFETCTVREERRELSIAATKLASTSTPNKRFRLTAVPRPDSRYLVAHELKGDKFARKNADSHPADVGFILVDADWQLLYANQEARNILVYPAASMSPRKFESAWTPLRNEIFPTLANRGSSSMPSSSHTIFRSGRRKYICRAFALSNGNAQKPQAPVAVILERSGTTAQIMVNVCTRFRLTTRESEVVAFTIQGLTNKEIAARMSISPNTVRAFVRTVMVKLGVSTRSGIVGVVFRTIYDPTRT